MKTFLLMMTLMFSTVTLISCGDGKAENMGEKIDNSFEEAGENIDEAVDDAGNAIEDACEDVSNENC
ncbi:hypothetical protein TDB9533_02538 [Thalassocella blandensis]|nr:hypothetical protein TDB9533_02538 [Thalassocella blandensis]